MSHFAWLIWGHRTPTVLCCLRGQRGFLGQVSIGFCWGEVWWSPRPAHPAASVSLGRETKSWTQRTNGFLDQASEDWATFPYWELGQRTCAADFSDILSKALMTEWGTRLSRMLFSLPGLSLPRFSSFSTFSVLWLSACPGLHPTSLPSPTFSCWYQVL